MSRYFASWRSTIAVLVFAGSGAVAAAPDADLPRYRFVPGQHLVYEGSEVAKTASGSLGLGRTTEVRVVRANDDGSWRVIVTHRAQRFNERNGERTLQPERHNLFLVDVYPDGRLPLRATDSFGVLNKVLPQLPADAGEAQRGWAFMAADVRVGCSPRSASTPGTWSFQLVPESAMWSIHKFSAAFTYEFDSDRGLVRSFSGQHRARGRDTRVEQERLVRTDTIDDATLAALVADVDRAYDAERAYRHEYAEAFAASDAAAGNAQLAAAVKHLEAARAELRSELLGGYIEGIVRQHRYSEARLATQIQQNARAMGRPAPDWSVNDLDGRAHALADYRGKVVVLDFWYRNCGWCIRAMPQLAQLAERFADRPVAVLGMNVDKDVVDARHVVDILKIEYPTLLVDRRIAAAHGVRAYPTLFVLDTEGRMRRIHRGYSGTLLDELTEVIESLLAEAAP